MKRNSTFAVARALTLLASFCVFASGCAHWPATPRLEQAGAPGYRLAEVTRPGQSDDLLVVLAISGGGTRAAALGRAIATSTALPPLLTPITLENRGGTCGRKAPAWQNAAEAAIGESETPGRALLRARALQSYENPARPYIHLFDGGLSENLGLTEVLRAFELLKVDPDEAVLPGLRRARKVVVITVNALRFPEVDWDRSPAPPGTDTLEDQMWSIPIDRISLDVVEQVREKLASWQADASAGGPERRGYLAQVTFDTLKDPAERLYFKRVKTSLTLPKEQVDRLREVGGRLLREAPAFRRLLVDLK